LFAQVARAVLAVGNERLERTYQTTFWFPLSQRPRSVVEEAALALARRLPRAVRAHVTGVEWWLSRMRTSDVPVDFHRDHDIRRARRGRGVAHPVLSSVLFLNRARGGLLAVTADPPDPRRPSCAPARLDRMDLVRPSPNRFAAFDGRLTHGVLDHRNQVPDRARPKASERARGPLRLAIILNWWTSRPWSVPRFADLRAYPPLALAAPSGLGGARASRVM
ncbi:MAG TPA: hypothetical protein VND93_27885, partial [Myxococcales bacterium]|nr:hypothetical protein [Myxococcales bacterium]